MGAGVKGSVETAWGTLEYPNEEMDSSITSYTIHLENRRNGIIQNSRALPKDLTYSTLMICFKNALQHHGISFLEYMKQFKLLKKLARTLSLQQSSITWEKASSSHYIIPQWSTNENFSIARIWFTTSEHCELFPLRFILMNVRTSYFSYGRIWGVGKYGTFRDAPVPDGLYEYKGELKKCFEEANRMRIKSTEMSILGSLNQFEAEHKHNVWIMWVQICIQRWSSRDHAKKEVFPQLVEKSDRCCDCFLIGQTLFSSKATRSTIGSENSTVCQCLQKMNTSECCSQLH